MRTKLLEAGRSLPALLPEKEGGFRTTFRGVSSIRPQVATWIVFLAALLLAFNVAIVFGGSSTFRFNTGGPFLILGVVAAIFDILSLAVGTLALSPGGLTYLSPLKGVRGVSEGPLGI